MNRLALLSLFSSIVVVASACADSGSASAESAGARLRRADRLDAAALAALVADAHGVARDATEIGGYVALYEDARFDSHGASVYFSSRYFFERCFDVLPLAAGGKCHLYRSCPGPAPASRPPSEVDVGMIEIESTYEAARIDVPEQHSIEGTGPFWRGDGDMIKVSISGQPGVAPPLRWEVRAPVGDAVARLPRGPVDRTTTLPISWRYGNGDRPAEGDMVVSLGQTNGSAYTEVACAVPIARRSMELPPAVLGRFAAGRMAVGLHSTTSRSLDETVSEGVMKISLVADSVVDIGAMASSEVELR